MSGEEDFEMSDENSDDGDFSASEDDWKPDKESASDSEDEDDTGGVDEETSPEKGPKK